MAEQLCSLIYSNEAKQVQLQHKGEGEVWLPIRCQLSHQVASLLVAIPPRLIAGTIADGFKHICF